LALLRVRSGLAVRQNRIRIHFTERVPKKAPSRRTMDFAPHLWLSCNKLAVQPAFFARD
jgi:hypothetical protein